MRKIDYTLDILGEGNTYIPRPEFIGPINNSKNKIFEITADNSYGKTFILNLLAYALEADKLDEAKILNSIKNSISRYDNENSYLLEYKINLGLPDGKELLLSKEKNGGKIIKMDNSPPIGHANLHNELSIIYDVPTNPSERLNAVIKDLGLWNKNLEEKFDSLSKKIYELTKEFDSVRNEEKIETLKNKLEETKAEIDKKRNDKDKKNEVLVELETLSSLNNLKLLLKKKMDLESKFHKKSKEFKGIPKPVKIEKKDEKEIERLNSELFHLESDFSSIIRELITEINNDEDLDFLFKEDISKNKHYNLIKKTTVKDLNNSEHVTEIASNFLESLEEIKTIIKDFIYEKKNDKSYVIHNTFKQLIEVVEEMIENDIYHLLKDVTSVEGDNLKGKFESVLTNYRIKDYSNLQKFLSNDLTKIKGIIAQHFRTLTKLEKEKRKKMVDDDDSKYYKVKSELNEIKDKLKKVDNNYDITRITCADKIGIKNLNEFNSIESFSDTEYLVEQKIDNKELLSDINFSKDNLIKEIKSIENQIEDLNQRFSLTSVSYEMENSRKPSKYSDDQKKKIKKFLNYLFIVNNNMKSFKELISNIENNNLSGFKDEEDLNFIALAGRIIAYSMDNKLLRADGIYVDLEHYDMLNQQFHCSDNIIINKADVSTGLASANYLKQRIENVEGKYVVVLLDEIGNMAKNAIDKVIESLKKLENQNRLVLAVLTRPNSNGIEIIEY